VARWLCGPGARRTRPYPPACPARRPRALSVGARRPREGTKWHQGAGDFVPRGGESCPVALWAGGPVALWPGGPVAR